jgi:Tol biopolymer transport system component
MNKYLIRLASLLLAFSMITGLTSCSLSSRSDRDRLEELEEEVEAIKESQSADETTPDEDEPSVSESEKSVFDDLFPESGEGLIVYSMRTKNTQDEESNWELYIMNEDGEEPIRLTYTEHINEGAPSISADGSKIVFVCHVSPEEMRHDAFGDGGGSLSVMDIDGGNRQDFTHLGYTPYFSPDGSRIYLYCGYAFKSFSVDGTDEKVLIDNLNDTCHSGLFIVTDKGYVYFSSEGEGFQLHTVNHDGSDSRPITDFAGGFYGRMNISSDRKNIVVQFTGDTYRDHPDRGLYLIDLESSERIRLIDSMGYKKSPVFSPDGSTVYYYKHTAEESFICAIGTDGKSDRVVTKIIDNPGSGSICVISEDGEKIWFISDQKLFTCDADGSNLVQLTEEYTFCLSYTWIPE